MEYALELLNLTKCFGEKTAVDAKGHARDSLKNANQAQPVLWLGMLTTSVGMTLFGGVHMLLTWLSPQALLPVMALLLGLLCLFYHRIILPVTARYLDARRESLVQALG
jgi:hypothetical protein